MDEFESHESPEAGESAAPAGPDETAAPEVVHPRVEPPESRFLFVDIAAQRAKQLRRGARSRLAVAAAPHKLERIAMQEVRDGLIAYQLPGQGPGKEEAA